MPSTSRATKLAIVAGATVLASGATPAVAHDGWTTTSGTPTYDAPALDMQVPLNAGVYHAFLDRKLDLVEAYVTALKAKVNAIPADTVLTGDARDTAQHRLAKASAMRRLLALIPTTGPYAATAAEHAQVDTIEARLAAIKSTLKALLANEAVVVTPTTVKVATVTKTHVLGTRFDRDAARTWWLRWSRWSGWSGWDGDRDGDRWDGHHCDGDHR
jgi:hypothetical protein